MTKLSSLYDLSVNFMEEYYERFAQVMLPRHGTEPGMSKVYRLKRRVLVHLLLAIISCTFAISKSENDEFFAVLGQTPTFVFVLHFLCLYLIRTCIPWWIVPCIQLYIWIYCAVTSPFESGAFLISRYVTFIDVVAFLLGSKAMVLFAIAALGSFDYVVDYYFSHNSEVPTTRSVLRLGGLVFMFWTVIYRYITESTHERLYTEVSSKDEHKTQFLGKMSHEMRTPLVGIIGSADLLWSELQGPEPTDPEKFKEYLGIIRSCSHHLLDLINDVLDYTKVSSGSLSIQQNCVHINDITHIAFDAVVPAATLRGLSIRCDVKPSVPHCFEADATRLRQVLMNLLTNAVKFTEKGSVELEVTLQNRERCITYCAPSDQPRKPADVLTHGKNVEHSCHRKLTDYEYVCSSGKLPSDTDSFVVFSIQDTGIGMSKEFLSRMYDPFSQGHEGFSRNYGGSGLGLNIAKALVLAMNGCITVGSTPHQGTRFVVCLPLRSCSARRASVCNHDSDESRPRPVEATSAVYIDNPEKRVLLAEDVPVSQKILSNMLRKIGVQNLDVAANGVEVLQLIKQHGCGAYTAILLDIEMPLKNGIETIAEIRQLEGGQDVYICALTAHALESTGRLLLQSSFNDWVSKPTTHDSLVSAMNRAKQHGAQKSHRAPKRDG